MCFRIVSIMSWNYNNICSFKRNTASTNSFHWLSCRCGCFTGVLPHIPEKLRGISTSDPVLCSLRTGFQSQPAPCHAWSSTNWPGLSPERAEKRSTTPFRTLSRPVETIAGRFLSLTPAVLQTKSFADGFRPSSRLLYKTQKLWKTSGIVLHWKYLV